MGPTQLRHSCNATILPDVLRYQIERGDAVVAVALEQASPMAWQYVNIYGRYELSKSVQPIDIEETVQELVIRSGPTHLTR